MNANKIGILREEIRFQLGQQIAYDENVFCWFIKKQERIEGLQAENDMLRAWLIKIRKSREIMEARRFAEEALKGE